MAAPAFDRRANENLVKLQLANRSYSEKVYMPKQSMKFIKDYIKNIYLTHSLLDAKFSPRDDDWRYDQHLNRHSLAADLFYQTVADFDFIVDSKKTVRTFNIFEAFEKDGQIFQRPRAMARILGELVHQNEAYFYYLSIASHISRKTWQEIYKYVTEEIVDGNRQQTAASSACTFVACLKLASWAFTDDQKNAMLDYLGRFHIDNYRLVYEQRDSYVPDLSLPVIAYEKGTTIDDERIIILTGKDPIRIHRQLFSKQRLPPDPEILPITEIDLLDFITRKLKRLFEFSKKKLEEIASSMNAEDEYLLIMRQRMFDFSQKIYSKILPARKRLCTREFVEQLLVTIAFDLPVYLYYELALFSMPCVAEGVLTMFEVMKIVENVQRMQKNARQKK